MLKNVKCDGTSSKANSFAKTGKFRWTLTKNVLKVFTGTGFRGSFTVKQLLGEILLSIWKNVKVCLLMMAAYWSWTNQSFAQNFLFKGMFSCYFTSLAYSKKTLKEHDTKKVTKPILLDLIRIERAISNPWLPLFQKWNLEFKIQYCKSFAEIWFQVLKSVEFCRRPQNEASPSSELLQCHRGEARDLFHQTSQDMQILLVQCFNSTESGPG